MKSDFQSSVLDQKIKNENVIRVSRGASAGQTPEFVAVDYAVGAGLAPISWMVRLPDGRMHNLTGAASPAEIEKMYAADESNPYRDNLFFKLGFVAPLFPMANRLIGTKDKDNFVKATVAGSTVRMPLNNKASIPGAIPHHLHGLIFGQTAKNVNVDLAQGSAAVTGDFQVEGQAWKGNFAVSTKSEVQPNGYSFYMTAKNVGTTPAPVGAGAHPYFSSPDMARDSIRVHVPAESLVEINNLFDVLPTGKIKSVAKSDPALNFTAPEGTLLHEKEIAGNRSDSRFDNLWVDLKKDANGFAYCDVFFPHSKMKVRMTALTKNVIGIQGYAPKYKEGVRPFVALELVTNLPDPREALWKKTPTGMKVLQPGETFEYGYKVEIFSTL